MCCIFQANELEREIKHKTGERSRGLAKNVGGPWPTKKLKYSIRLSYFGFGCACGIHVIWTSVLQTAPKEVVNLLSAVVSLNNGESN